MSNLFANAALSAAFVPVFTDLLQQGRKREAFRLASTLFWIMLIVLGAFTAFFVLAAGVIMPLFTGPTFNGALDALTVGLSQVLFPVVLLIGLIGLMVGVLQSYEHFTIPAIAPAVWNLVIIVLLVLLRPHFHGGYENGDQLYAYAIAILVATVVQLIMVFGALARIDFRLQFSIDWHDPRIRQVFGLMLPVTIGLGIVNLDQLINSVFGTLVSDEAPRAIDNAFRIYMLPQGLFSVAVATRAADPQPDGGQARGGEHAARDRSRHAPDQPALDPGVGVPDRAHDPRRAARVRTRAVRRALDRNRLDRVVLVRVQPSVRRFEPAVDPCVLRGAATVDPHPPGGAAEHDRRHHRVHRPVQAARHRRIDNRHGRGQRRDGGASVPPPADRVQRSPGRRPDVDDHRSHPPCIRAVGRCLVGGLAGAG